MKIFSIYKGLSRIEFSVHEINGKYQAKINNLVLYEGPDYELIRSALLEDLDTNIAYNSLTH